MDTLNEGHVPLAGSPPIRALKGSIARCARQTFLVDGGRLDPERCPSGGDGSSGETARAAETIARNRVVFWQGESHDQEIEIVEGVIRAVHLCESGERQVLAFFWPGTVIRPTLRHVQSYTAEAVTTCVVRPRRFQRSVEAPGAIGANEQVLQEMLHLLRGISRRSALSRLAWFILRMRRHLPRVSPGSDVYRFVIPRGDMADHLGLSLETVSRGLTILKTKGVIDLPSRKTIRFCGLAQLARLEDG